MAGSFEAIYLCYLRRYLIFVFATEQTKISNCFERQNAILMGPEIEWGFT